MKKIIETDRLILQPLSNQDVDRMIALYEDSEITNTYMIPEFHEESEKIALFQRMQEYSNSEQHFVYGIYTDHILIGWINEVEIHEDAIELGYVIDPKYCNQGYATEALSCAIEELLEKYSKVICGFFEGNIASKRVMEKAGMHPSGKSELITYRGHTYKCIYYEIEKGDLND